jgi:exodeoxyribonuclease VII large subunit
MVSASTSPDAARIWTVSEINRLVKDVLEQTFYPFWLQGEVSNCTIHRSGHVYFTLKDAASQVAAVFFRGAPQARQAGLRDGLLVEVHGRLGVYEPRGQYQLIIDQVRPQGVGLLQQRFEELKKKLREEGLFDPERKRPIPGLPRCVGLVTSPSGAALRDFIQVVHRRFASLHVRVYPAAVQGEKAAAEVVAGIRFFNEIRGCDVIVVTRGGGSLEDLWPFNEETVARAVAASAIPVISAVGHEVDYTICDFAADLRAPTPSAAAELVVARKAELQERLGHLRQRLAGALQLRLSQWRRRLERAARSPVFAEPRHVVRTAQQRVDELALRAGRALVQTAALARSRLERAAGTLQALNPRAVLSRGYAVLLDARSGRAVTTAEATPLGSRLRALLERGELDLLVAGRRLEPAAPHPTHASPNTEPRP